MFTNAVNYQNYRLIKKCARYDDEFANKSKKKTKKTAVQMRDRTFSGKDAVWTVVLLQDLKAAREACKIHEGTATWLFRPCLSGRVEALVKTRMALQTKTARSEEWCLASFSTMLNYLLKQFVTDENTAPVDTDIRNFKIGSLTSTEYSPQLWNMTLRCSSIYN